jgi:hypothetical protein
MMNKLIEQIADDVVANLIPRHVYCEIPDEFVESFAQAIVQECVEVCAGIAAVREGYNDADGRDTAYSCGDMIKEQFGIES